MLIDSMLSSSVKMPQVTVVVAVTLEPALLAVVAVSVKSILVYSLLGEAYIGVCGTMLWMVFSVVFALVAL